MNKLVRENKFIIGFLLITIILILIYFYFLYKKDNILENKTSLSKIKVFNFNTEWCGWSKKFQPEWEIFMQHVKEDPSLGYVEAYDVKCDNDNNKMMCKKYNVPGFPYIVIENEDKYLEYDGDRSAHHLLKYIKEKYAN